MAFQLPNLDDETFADLVAEARASIPGLYPAWTDHNPSDPGIALIELFAWLAEMMVYRTNQLPAPSRLAFLALLNGSGWSPPPGAALDDLVRSTLQGVRQPFRAVTPDDYEQLAATQWPAAAAPALPRLMRARCLGERDLEGQDKTAAAPGHVSLIVAPDTGDPAAPWGQPDATLCAALAQFFADRRLITTRLHVTGPDYVAVPVAATLYLRDDAVAEDVRARAADAVRRYFHPWTGGAGRDGWPFGRDVHASEVYALLDAVEGVEKLDTVLFGGSAVVSVPLAAHALARVDDVSFTLKERRGGQWQTISG